MVCQTTASCWPILSVRSCNAASGFMQRLVDAGKGLVSNSHTSQKARVMHARVALVVEWRGRPSAQESVTVAQRLLLCCEQPVGAAAHKRKRRFNQHAIEFRTHTRTRGLQAAAGTHLACTHNIRAARPVHVNGSTPHLHVVHSLTTICDRKSTAPSTQSNSKDGWLQKQRQSVLVSTNNAAVQTQLLMPAMPDRSYKSTAQSMF